MYQNPLSTGNFSDPYLTYDKDTGYYYFMASCQCNILTMYRSKTVHDIIEKGDKKDIFIAGYDEVYGPMWAPEMIKIGKHWYIYTSCQKAYHECTFALRKALLILKSKTEDPFDGFEFGSKPDPEMFAIDPTTTIIDGKQYVCYSRVDEKYGQVLDIVEMKDPLTFAAPGKMIAYATYPWEKVEGYDEYTLNEGAFFVRRNNKLYIIYSANGCWSDDYCLGVLEHLGGDLMDANNWKKHDKPLFIKGNGVYGVGHATFFYSPDGTELWCAYHCLEGTNPERLERTRWTCIQKVEFDENDYPVMGDPVKHNVVFDSPSGE